MKVHSFNDLEGLRIAAEMERRGGDFYQRAARISKSEEARALLGQLASDERAHQAEFERYYRRTLEARQEEEFFYDEETNAFLTAIAADIVFPEGLVGLSKEHGLESPAAILDTAMQSEKDSILYYGEMTRVAHDEEARRVFRDIIAQERAHLAKLEGQARR